MRKYIFTSYLIFLSIIVNAKSIQRIHIDSLTYSNQTFELNGNKFTGIVYATFNSGEIKYEWDISEGLPHGNVIGYHKNCTDSIFKYSYKYTYVKGNKIGKQFEYYLKEDSIPFYVPYDDLRPKELQWIITDFNEDYFGNKDGLEKINFSQSRGCGINTDKKKESIYTLQMANVRLDL